MSNGKRLDILLIITSWTDLVLKSICILIFISHNTGMIVDLLFAIILMFDLFTRLRQKTPLSVGQRCFLLLHSISISSKTYQRRTITRAASISISLDAGGRVPAAMQAALP